MDWKIELVPLAVTDVDRAVASTASRSAGTSTSTRSSTRGCGSCR